MNYHLRSLASVALVLSVAACSDGPTAPVAHEGGANFSLVGSLLLSAQGDTTVTQFTVDPKTSTTFQVGSGHIVYFPKYSICDLGSSYGPAEWDRPCAVTNKPVTITAKTWIDGNGQPQVDFSPAMRFTTSNQAAGNTGGDVVTIAMAIDPTKAANASSMLKILYCASPLLPCADESLTDASLKTTVNLADGYVYRRIKHFSGYNVSSGRVEMLMGDPLMSRSGNDDGDDAPGRSGHLMSSGRSEQ